MRTEEHARQKKNRGVPLKRQKIANKKPGEAGETETRKTLSMEGRECRRGFMSTVTQSRYLDRCVRDVGQSVEIPGDSLEFENESTRFGGIRADVGAKKSKVPERAMCRQAFGAGRGAIRYVNTRVREEDSREY